jgi:excinuclease ABC subunit B
MSPAMKAALDETARRRSYQIAYNERHGITPRSATKAGDQGGAFAEQLAARKDRAAEPGVTYQGQVYTPADIPELTTRMITAAEELKFEEAARWRDLIHRIESDGQAAADASDDAPAKAKSKSKSKSKSKGKGKRRGRR